jgi:tetraacyldisaccharide 4'-kinase
MPYTDAVLAVGEGSGADHVVRMAARAGKPVFSARQRPLAGSGIAGRRVLAFAGIGDPVKFFRTVEDAGGEIALKRAFPDHHFYAPDELADLAGTAEKRGLELATTAKDAARIFDGTAATKDFLENLHVVEIDMVFDPDTIPRQIIGATLEAWRERRLAG